MPSGAASAPPPGEAPPPKWETMLVNPECHICVEMGTKGAGPRVPPREDSETCPVPLEVPERVASKSGWFTYGFTPDASSGALEVSTSSVGMRLTAVATCRHTCLSVARHGAGILSVN